MAKKNDTKQFSILFMALFITFAILYLVNISGWLMHDDEGTDFYEVWQLQQGQQPGVDFIAEQQPLFLLVGKAIVGVAGRSPAPLRLLSAVQVLLGAFILTLAVHKIWGSKVAVITLGLILSSSIMYEQARLFRPDPMMIAWEMAGLGLLLLAAKGNHRHLWAIAGFCYGFAILWKLFGVFPVAGIVFFFLHLLWRNRAQWRQAMVTGLFFAVPFLLVSLGVSAWLYSQLGFYYGEAFANHLQSGHAIGPLAQFAKVMVAYAFFLVSNIIFIFVLPLWLLNKPAGWREQPEVRLLVWQLLSPAIFLFIFRPLHLRYFFHLTPVFALLLAWQVDLAFSKTESGRAIFDRFAPVITLFLVGFAIITSLPGFPKLLTRQEPDTLELAALVAANTRPDDVVLSDYAGINFFAGRRSIYEASIIAGAQIEGQVITADLLIDRIETDEVEMILLHVEGGNPPPHQLVNLVDYDDFRKYVTAHFELLTLFDRAGQQIEVYQRQ